MKEKNKQQKKIVPRFATLPQTASPTGVVQRDGYNLYDDTDRLRHFDIENKK